MLITINDLINEHIRIENGIYIHQSINRNDVIYKYIRKNHFIEMIRNMQLYISNRQRFSDRREKKWKENNRMRFLLCPALPTEKEKKDYGLLSNKIEEAYNICISCWTYDRHNACDESIMNWKCYGKDAYRLETTIGNLIGCIRPTNKDIIVCPVKYEKNEYDGSVYNAIFRKYISYQDEQELRLVLLSTAEYELVDIDVNKLVNKIRLSPFYSPIHNRNMKEELEHSFPFLSSKVELSHLYEDE